MHDWAGGRLGMLPRPPAPVGGGAGWNHLAFSGSAQLLLGCVPAACAISRSRAVFEDGWESGLAPGCWSAAPCPGALSWRPRCCPQVCVSGGQHTAFSLGIFFSPWSSGVLRLWNSGLGRKTVLPYLPWKDEVAPVRRARGAREGPPPEPPLRLSPRSWGRTGHARLGLRKVTHTSSLPRHRGAEGRSQCSAGPRNVCDGGVRR